MKEKLFYLDKVLGYLLDELKSHHLFDKLNLIVTSDHGMEAISNKTAIFLDSHIDTDLFDAFGSRAVGTLFVKKASDIEYVYKTLKKIQNIDVYKREDLPEHLHYKHNVRTGDIVIISKIGYTVYVKNQTVDWNVNRGNHGYYNSESSMLPIFIAHGPFIKKNYTIKPFNNVDLYPLMCLLLGVDPAVNNGSLSTVIDMVVYNPLDKKFIYTFVLLSLIPMVMVLVTSVFLCQMSRRVNPITGGSTPSHSPRRFTGYRPLVSSETTVYLGDDYEEKDGGAEFKQPCFCIYI